MVAVRLLSVVLLLLTANLSVAAEPAVIVQTDDWESEANQARQSGVPVMVVFSAENCPYCDRLKTEVLAPNLQQGQFARRVHIREFDIDRGGKITDFDGEPIRGRIFVSRYEVFATPTVLLLDHSGELLTAPLIGFDNPEDYNDRLRNNIASALHTLATGPRYVMGNGPE